MMIQNSKQSQNKKSVSDFHNSCNVKEEIMRTPVLEFL